MIGDSAEVLVACLTKKLSITERNSAELNFINATERNRMDGIEKKCEK